MFINFKGVLVMAKISKAKMEANRRWNEKNYFRVALNIPKAWESELKQYAADNDTTVNKLLNSLIANALGKESSTNTSVDTSTSAELTQKINDLESRLEVALKMNNIEQNQELATLKAEISKAFKLDYEDFQNSKGKELSQELFDIYRVIISRFFKGLERFGISFNDTNTSVDNNTNTSVLEETKKDTNTSDDVNTSTSAKKPPITPEMVALWDELNADGLSFATIAKNKDGCGYDSSTISRRVAKLRKSQDQD